MRTMVVGMVTIVSFRQCFVGHDGGGLFQIAMVLLEASVIITRVGFVSKELIFSVQCASSIKQKDHLLIFVGKRKR